MDNLAGLLQCHHTRTVTDMYIHRRISGDHRVPDVYGVTQKTPNKATWQFASYRPAAAEPAGASSPTRAAKDTLVFPDGIK